MGYLEIRAVLGLRQVVKKCELEGQIGVKVNGWMKSGWKDDWL